MRYCCPKCRTWNQLNEDRELAGQCCDYCSQPVRVAGGLLAQIAAERVTEQKYDLRGDTPWPPDAQCYLAELRREGLRPKPPRRSNTARLIGPLACAVILVMFGIVTQVYLGHRYAMAQDSDESQATNGAPIVAPPLILEEAPAPAAQKPATPSKAAKPLRKTAARHAAASSASSAETDHPSNDFFGVKIPD